MGYTTDFTGQFELNKQLDLELHTFLTNFSLTRHMKRNINGFGVEGEFYIPEVKRTKQGSFETDESYNTVTDHNKPPCTQPGLWCQWIPNDKGTAIQWDGGEKFYSYVEWIKYIISNFLAPKGYELNGEVSWQGEDNEDFGIITIQKNKVFIMEGQKSYSEPKEA